MIGSAASIVSRSSATRITICLRPASSGCSSLVPVTSTAAQRLLGLLEIDAEGGERAGGGGLRVGEDGEHQVGCEPTGAVPASRAASVSVVSAAGEALRVSCSCD